MTPGEQTEIENAASLIIESCFSLIVSCALYGESYSKTSMTLIQIEFDSKGRPGPMKKAMLCLVLSTFAMVTPYYVVYQGSPLIIIKHELMVSLPGGIKAQITAANSQLLLKVFSDIIDCLCNSIVLLVDAVIVWRAWAMFMDSKTVKLLLVFLVVVDIGVTIADCVADTKNVMFWTVSLDWAQIIVSLSVNLAATCLIAIRAWQVEMHRRESTRPFHMRTRKTQVEEVLILLVESGAIYALIQIASLTTRALDVGASVTSPTPLAAVRSIIDQMYLYSACLNPVAICVLVQTRSTYYEHSSYLDESHTLALVLSQENQHVFTSEGDSADDY
ncbi:hypothetical protein BDP27DRAFT_1342558 [Rhodocollybia butyracea]|uniref:Uncharacterized protein n=1 Tax=Rhodocollybia butyracea TaxID=206335 RepID=A0A9P5P8N8_9AGAR|nr:hypothetical protein BDP27DRAFT_1342558 [Rhodocollybia butyracea]